MSHKLKTLGNFIVKVVISIFQPEKVDIGIEENDK